MLPAVTRQERLQGRGGLPYPVARPRHPTSMMSLRDENKADDAHEPQFSFKLPWAKKEGEEEKENPIRQIKKFGVAGVVSYALWEGAFWTLGGVGGLYAYYLATGHWPDLSNPDDAAKVGGEAFAFVNLARFAVPLRIGLAVGTAPWVDENIIKRFGDRAVELGEGAAEVDWGNFAE